VWEIGKEKRFWSPKRQSAAGIGILFLERIYGKDERRVEHLDMQDVW